MTSDGPSIRSAFRLAFDADLTLRSLDRLLVEHPDPGRVRHFVRTLPPGALDDLGVLEWAYCNAVTSERAEELERLIVKKSGLDRFHCLNAAQQFVSRMESSTEYTKVCNAVEFFVRHEELGLSPFQLRGCRTVEQMEEVLALHARIAGGDLYGFYHGGVPLLDLGGYSVGAVMGQWEVLGGVSLYLSSEHGELVKVGGYFRWKDFQPATTIISIQGAPGTRNAQQEARKRLGLHPANALILLYLEMSRVFGQERVRIRSRASPEYNTLNEDSEFYRIPRNTFRLRVDAGTGLYECDAARRDSILEKFAKSHPLLAETFARLDAHL